MLPPYITAEEVDFEADLGTVNLMLSIATSLLLITAYTRFE